MSSGIVVPDAVLNAFKDVQSRKYSSVVIKVTDEALVVDKQFSTGSGDPAAQWKEVVSGLSENECRFILCDFQVKETELVTKGKLIIISWSPDYSPIRAKMVHASTLTNLTNQIEVQKTVQATELQEIDYETLKDAVFSS